MDVDAPGRAPLGHNLHTWGLFGAFFAIVFAIWMLFFPDLVAPYFAWNVHPRAAQVFIAAGYVFRTGFFLTAWREPSWQRIRWIYWGNFAFTGTLLLATFWHAEAFHWAFPISTGHLWLFLYVSEPLALLYQAPRGPVAHAPAPPTGGPLLPGFRILLLFETGFLGAVGALLVINPAFATIRWPWELNPLDSRIVAAWFVGWAVWAGTLAFAADWDEAQLAVRLQALFGLAVLAGIAGVWPLLDIHRGLYIGIAIALTLGTLVFYWLQERARPGAVPIPTTKRISE